MERDYRAAARVFKALCDPKRLAILEELRGGEKCACVLQEPMEMCIRDSHVAGSQWGNKKYMNMKHLEAAIEDASIAG